MAERTAMEVVRIEKKWIVKDVVVNSGGGGREEAIKMWKMEKHGVTAIKEEKVAR